MTERPSGGLGTSRPLGAAHTTDDLSEILERQGGLLGLCGTADMREVIARADEGDADAQLALDVWWHRLADCARPWPPRSAVSTSWR